MPAPGTSLAQCSRSDPLLTVAHCDAGCPASYGGDPQLGSCVLCGTGSEQNITLASQTNGVAPPVKCGKYRPTVDLSSLQHAKHAVALRLPRLPSVRCATAADYCILLPRSLQRRLLRLGDCWLVRPQHCSQYVHCVQQGRHHGADRVNSRYQLRWVAHLPLAGLPAQFSGTLAICSVGV
jgi:hypothetical protein